MKSSFSGLSSDSGSPIPPYEPVSVAGDVGGVVKVEPVEPPPTSTHEASPASVSSSQPVATEPGPGQGTAPAPPAATTGEEEGRRTPGCLALECQQHTETGNNYCSQDCQIRAQLEKISDSLPHELLPCVTLREEGKNSGVLAVILAEEKRCKEELGLLLYQQQRLEVIINTAADTAMNESFLEGSKKVTNLKSIGTLLTFHCALCNKQISSKTLFDHMGTCYQKYEDVIQSDLDMMVELRNSIKLTGGSREGVADVFCHEPDCFKLKYLCTQHYTEFKISPQDACGCPLTIDHTLNDIQNFCPAPKLYCMEHFGWQRLRRAEISLTRLHLWFQLLELIEQERLTRLQMCSQSSILGQLYHSTITLDAVPPPPPPPPPH